MPKVCNWLSPDWPAPKKVRALVTCREGGVSAAPFDGLNLALHVDDDPKAVLENRQLLTKEAKLPSEPFWLNQVHGVDVVEVGRAPSIKADASVAFSPHQVCCVLTADCLPLLICHEQGDRVAAIHAGWRGLAAGVIEATIDKLDCDPKSLLVWLGPAIGPNAFEVGQDVVDAFKGCQTENSFKPNANHKWQANLYDLARYRLRQLGVEKVYGGEYCTYSDKRFYSFRRSKVTGRMASLIWIE